MTEMRPYKVPAAGMEYNEFVGSLGPYGNGNPVNTELHVRYGVRAGKYFDWTIELIAARATSIHSAPPACGRCVT